MTAAERLLDRHPPKKALALALERASGYPEKHYLRWFYTEIADEIREEAKRRYGYELDGLGKLVLTSYDPFVPIVAKAYLARPVFEPAYAFSWRALTRHIDVMFKRLQSKIEVIFTDRDPYPDYAAMIADIKRGRMLVYTGSSEHPVFSPEENWRFRAVHDYIAHAGGEHTFSLRGEMAAYNRHVKLAPPDARLALFVEIVAQTSCFFYTGAFCEQKVCGMFGFDFVNVGVVDDVEYARNFE